MSILIAILILAILIVVHEWGHFIVARRIGIPVHEFSLGFGYRILSVQRNGVEYSWRAIPLGGYVRMAGEEPGDDTNPEGFNNRTPLEKIRVAFAGPAMNFVLAILIFIYSFAVIGIAKPVGDAVIGDVLEGKPAAEAGLKADDRILAVNGKEVMDWEAFVNAVRAEPAGATLDLTVERNGKVNNLTVETFTAEGSEEPMIGVYSKVIFEKQGIGSAIKYGFIQTYEMTILLFQGLGMLFTGEVSSGDLAGPVGITSMVGEAARGGMVYLLAFTAFLSINLGILNLLPIPALDGSRILFSLVEIVRRKPLDPDKEGMIHWFGFLFLMGLLLLVTYNDIIRLIRG